ncbi:hypothetical protein SADUNF_Sadunf12G0030500 [Salix dunnii]|uniref:Uncharacterized protein n=1 Tax=Salix dunnii TaxID=1413687 RepID=A0A835JKV1_9ROSI|nr:hypothetical protein SADUNF_Sadunf12G0030500 [Salix dunnii]
MESSSMNNTVEKDVDLLVDTAEAEVLKKRISSHPLYGLLVQTHIDCLKVLSLSLSRSLLCALRDRSKICIQFELFLLAFDDQVGTIGGVDQSPRVRPMLPSQFPNPSSLSQPELDSFMEAYCFALSKLKEAMEEPQQETAAFINSMHLQLKELTRTHSKSTSEHPTSATSSGELLYFIPLLSLLCCQAMNDNSWVLYVQKCFKNDK